jgi:head-tail adaptor
MLAAALKELITIQVPTRSQDAIGSTIDTWVDLGTRRAQVLYDNGNKSFENDISAELSSSNVTFIFRHIEGLTHDCQILFGSEVAETLSAGTVTLTGTSGDITGITVNSVEIMNGTVTWDTDVSTVAVAIVASITAKTSVPEYTATNVAGVITITAIAGTGATPNTFVVATTESGGDIAAADVNLSGGVTQVFGDEHIILSKEKLRRREGFKVQTVRRENG